MAVTLINLFSGPKGKEDEFVKCWQEGKANITMQYPRFQAFFAAHD